MAFQTNAFQNNAFQVIVPPPNSGAGGRGYGRIVSSGPTHYPFGKKEAGQLAALEKKKKKLDERISEIEAELRRKELEAKSVETDRELSRIQWLKQKLLELWEQIQSLEAELDWLKELRENAEEAEMAEVYEVYMATRLH